MRRHEFITLVGGVAAEWSLAARAQQAMPVVGFLSSRSPGESAEVVAAFRRGLRQMGFVEGDNVIIAFRWAEGHYDDFQRSHLILLICMSPYSLRQAALLRVCGQSCDPDNSNRFCGQRPSAFGFGNEPEPAKR